MPSKRKQDDDDDDDDDDGDDDDMIDNTEPKISCTSMRIKIKKFLATKEMTQTQFLATIGCNSNSLGRFMKLRGPWSGINNGVFWGSQRFFAQRGELRGVSKKKKKKTTTKKTTTTTEKKVAEKKKAKEETTPANSTAVKAAKSTKKPPAPAAKGKARTKRAGEDDEVEEDEEKEEKEKKTTKRQKKSIKKTSTDDEDNDDNDDVHGDVDTRKLSKTEVEALLERVNRQPEPQPDVYDDCDDVRKKSLEFLAKYGVPTASFLRAIGNVNSNSWRTFLAAKGPAQGAGNVSYPKAYAFLEKLRVMNGEKKTAKRLKMEKGFRHGHSLKTPSRFVWMRVQPR